LVPGTTGSQTRGDQKNNSRSAVGELGICHPKDGPLTASKDWKTTRKKT